MSRYQSAYSDAELLEQRYIKECGECGIETIITVWLDDLPEIETKQQDHLGNRLRYALRSELTELQIAQWAAALVGNGDFETWLANQS